MRQSQKNKILTALQKRPWVTVREMMMMGIAKYTNRISDLRADGYIITNHQRYDKKRGCVLSRYHLEKGA